MVRARIKGAATGDSTPADAFTVPGSTAESDNGVDADNARDSGTGFVAVSIAFANWRVTAYPGSGTVDVDVSVTGYDASWPALKRTGADRTVRNHFHCQLDEVEGKWLVATG